MSSQEGGNSEQATEAIQSLGDFHQGSWKGRSTSFTVTADVAAGIVAKTISPDYQLDVSLTYSSEGSLALREVCSLTSTSSDEFSFASSRQVSLADSGVDCDAVDASYSLHTHHATSTTEGDDNVLNNNFPAEIVGTKKTALFTVEHCLTVSDDERVRLLALYGEKQDLIRVVVCDETRIPRDEQDSSSATAATPLTTADLLEMQSDMDRLVDKIAGQVKGPPSSSATQKSDSTDPSSSSSSKEIYSDPAERMQQLQDLQQQPSSSNTSDNKKDQNKDDDRGPALARRPMSLLELTSGVWLGDAIIRDNLAVSGDGKNTGGRASAAGKGFGASEGNGQSPSPEPAFASWAVGVQKVAREWLWDFGEQIRQKNDAGKALGADMAAALGQSMAGSICENQSLSRRIPKDKRMVYIDWNHGNGDNHVGFLLGSVSIQVPRFATFNTRQSKPFYTELCVYQSPVLEETSVGAIIELDPNTGMEQLPEVVCSRICRLYNSEGQLKQGCTSFYSLRRFDPEGEDQ